jgi:hypothetical protein
MGFAKGGADVALEEVGPAETVLRYNVKAQVGGKMAQLGARLIDSTAKSMADQFFDRFAAQVAPPVPAEVTPAPAPATAAAPAVSETGWQAGGVMDQVSRLLSMQFMGMPAQVWFGIGAFVVILLLLFAKG